MKFFRLVSGFTLALGLLGSSTVATAHGTGSEGAAEGLMVTRHFTGIWDQVDQEAQGLVLEVVERSDDSRRSVVYWYTYGPDRKTAWYFGEGGLVDERIDFDLYESTDVGFMQDARPGNDSVRSIGTMTIVFDSCDSGAVSYQTDHEEIGSGAFDIERVSEVMNTHCTGGISDDMHADGLFGEQRAALSPARQDITGDGNARYEDYPAHMEFEVEVDGLPDGGYHVVVGMRDQGEFQVTEGHGEMKFSSPAEDGHMPLNFDPRGMRIEVHDEQGAALSSFDDMFEEDGHDHHGDGDGHHGDDDHNYDCDFGPGPGHNGPGGPMGGHMGGMADCVDDGDFIEIEVELENTAALPQAKGEAEWEMNSHRVEFSVEIEDVPPGTYPLHVGGEEVGIIEAFEMQNGDVYGRIRFRDPENHGREHLDFDPRGQKIEVFQGETVILEAEFPQG